MNTLRLKQFFSVLFFIERYFQYPQEVFWVSIMPAGKTGRETGVKPVGKVNLKFHIEKRILFIAAMLLCPHACAVKAGIRSKYYDE